MLLPAIPDIITDFDISYNNASWLLTTYLIAGAVAAPIVGRLSDIHGGKRVIVVVITIYIFGIVMGGLSSDFTSLIISRVIQGVGIAMLPTAFGIIKGQFSQDKLAIAVGLFTSMSAVGSVIGLVIGASIIENLGWRATFFSIIPITIVLWFVIRRFIHDDQRPSKVGEDNPKSMVAVDKSGNESINRHDHSNGDTLNKSIDIKGAIFLATTITSFLLVLSYSDVNSVTNSTLVISFLLIGTFSLILFVIIERMSESPLVNLQLLSNKIIFSANIILLLIFLTKFAVFQTISMLVKSPEPLGFGGEATDIAEIQLPFMIVFLLFAPSSGIIISKLGVMKPTILGGIFTVLGCFGLFLFHSTQFLVSANLAIVAAGISLLQVGSMNIILNSTPRQFSGISLGMTVIFKMVGSSIGPVIAGMYMQTNQITLVSVDGFFPSPGSYALIFLTLSLISIVTVGLTIFIKRKVALAPPLVGGAIH